MFGIIDELIVEINGAIPYFYRIWGILFSGNYRKKVKAEYKRTSAFWVGYDVLMSVMFFAIECYCIYWLVSKSLS